MAQVKPPFIYPVPPETRISAGFDAWGAHWEPKATSGPHAGQGQHKGVDFACPVGTKVRAIAGGTVREVSQTDRGGLYVWIEHRGGWGSSYHHLAEALVQPGQEVLQGDAIARSGNSGSNTTGPHLHLTVRDPGKPGDNRVDPRPFAPTPYLDIGPEHWAFEAAKWARDPLSDGGLPLIAGNTDGELGRDHPLTTIRFAAILFRFFGLVMGECRRLTTRR